MSRLAPLASFFAALLLGCQPEPPQGRSPSLTTVNQSDKVDALSPNDGGTNTIVGMWNWEGNYLDVYHYIFRDDGTVSKYVVTKAQEDGRWKVGKDGKLYVTLRDGKESRVYRIESPTQMMDEGLEWSDDIDFPWTKVNAVRFPVGHRADNPHWSQPRQITTP